MRTQTVAADLGLDVSTSSEARVTPKANARLAKVKARGSRVIKLRTKQGKARITNTAMKPSVAYSAVGKGIAASVLKKLRGRFAEYAGLPSGACTTTFLATSKATNLGVDIPTLIVKQWLNLWWNIPEFRDQVELDCPPPGGEA